MITDSVVNIAYWINSSQNYRNTKKLFYNMLENSDFPYKKYVDAIMIFLILTSVMILVYEVKHPVPAWMDFYDIYVITTVFSIEYILRLWIFSDIHKQIVIDYEKARFLKKKFFLIGSLKKIFKQKIDYIISPYAIIDFLAIMPAYRPLRILRVFKLLRYTKSINQFVEVLVTKKFELYTLFFLLVFLVLSSGIAIYVFEAHVNEKIVTLFDAFYWALVTISTVGYGDISPVTNEGKAISMVIIVSGIAMISFVTSVIVSAFYEKLSELKTNRMIEELNREDEFLLICGYGQLAKTFLRENRMVGYQYIILDKDEERVKQAIKDGFKAIQDDASRHDVISRFDVLYSNVTVLCLTNSDIENIYIALNAKGLSKTIKVIARATDESMKRKFELAGVDYVLMPNSVANMMLVSAITQPVMYNGIHDILTGRDAAHMDEVTVTHSSNLIGKKVMDIDFKGDKLLLIGIQRGNKGEFFFNPKPYFEIMEHDILLLMGLKISIDYFKEKKQKGQL